MSMTRILVVAAALGLGLSGASACDFQRSAELDRTVVASVTSSQMESTPATAPIPTQEPVTVPAEEAE
jgi:hypothetical protein